jgi:hypothetical protein
LSLDKKFPKMSYAGQLEILLTEGKNLKSMDFFTKQDPYVKLFLDSQQIRSKTHSGGGKNPVWNQKLYLNVLPGQNVLRLEAWDEDAVNDDLIGEGTIPLDTVFKCGQYDTVIDLRTKKGSNAGQIRLLLTFESKHVAIPAQFQGSSPYASNSRSYAPVSAPGVAIPFGTVYAMPPYAVPGAVQPNYTPAPGYPPNYVYGPGNSPHPPPNYGYGPQPGYPGQYPMDHPPLNGPPTQQFPNIYAGWAQK